MSGENYGYTNRYGLTNNAQRNGYTAGTSFNMADRGHSKNQFKGRMIGMTAERSKEVVLRQSNLTIQQEKRPVRQQTAEKVQGHLTVAREDNTKLNKQVREMARMRQESFQQCIKTILYTHQQADIAINESGLGQSVKLYLSRLKATVIDLQKDKSELSQIKNYIKLVESAQNWVSVDLSTEWKTILGKSINDRKAIQECLIGNPIQIENLNFIFHTEKGINILKSINKLAKMHQLQQKMRTQWSTLAKLKSGSPHFSNSSHNIQHQSIDKVYESIKQLLVSPLQEELAQQKKKIADLSRQLESSRKTRPCNAPTVIDKHLSLIQEVAQLKKSKDLMQDRKNEQIDQLKHEIKKLQQQIKDAGSKAGSNSRIKFKETSARQLQDIISQRQSQLSLNQQLISKMKKENEALRKDIDNLKDQLKRNAEQKKSVELGFKLNLRDYERQLKLGEGCIHKLIDQKNGLEQSLKQIQATLGQKEQQIVKLNAILAQRDRQSNLLKSNQKQMSEKYELIMKEKNRLEDDLKYQRQRGSVQRKNVDASRQQIMRQRDELQRNNDKLQSQARQVANSYQALQIERNQLKRRLQSLQSSAKNQISTSQIRQTSTEVTSLQNLLKSKDRQLAELKSLSNSRNNKNEAIEFQINRLKTESAQQKQEIKAINLNLSQKIKQLQWKSRDYKLIEQKLQQAQLSLKQSESKAIALQREKAELNSIISRHERSIKAKDEEIKELMHTSETLQQMISEMADLKVNSSFSVEEKPQQSTKVIQLQDKISVLNKQIDQCKDIQERLEVELKSKEARITELLEQQQRRDELSGNIQAIQYQNSQLKNRMRQMQQLSRVNVDDQARIKALYQHQMLSDYYQYKLFLTQTLQEHYNRRIKRTKLIFYYDLLNKVNFHQYIDGVSSLLLIIKTASGMFLAGYTEGPFLRRSLDRDGLILSLTNRKYFTLMQHNRRAITYDEYYIIFGNSEIRLKSLENRVFSNFGISNGYYNSRGEKVTVLLGGGQHDREMDIETYEIYQVLFDDY